MWKTWLVTSKKVEKVKEFQTPEPVNLFMVNESAEKLNDNKRKLFHNIVDRDLYLTKRAIPDISTAVSFLTTRVRSPDKDDWKNQ